MTPSLRGARARACASLALALVACRGAAPGGAPVADGALGPAIDAGPAAPATAAPDPVGDALWARATDGGGWNLARLADHEGESGLASRGGGDPALRRTAAEAMAFAPEPGVFAGLPFLAEVARSGDDAQAEAALGSTIDLAARPRTAIDPEDAAEMKEGCDLLLALAKDEKAARSRRVKAVRALRMLAERGCTDPSAIPTELDAR